jgi:hypothetical protein
MVPCPSLSVEGSPTALHEGVLVVQWAPLQVERASLQQSGAGLPRSWQRQAEAPLLRRLRCRGAHFAALEAPLPRARAHTGLRLTCLRPLQGGEEPLTLPPLLLLVSS